jgi:hypothetical protein
MDEQTIDEKLDAEERLHAEISELRVRLASAQSELAGTVEAYERLAGRDAARLNDMFDALTEEIRSLAMSRDLAHSIAREDAEKLAYIESLDVLVACPACVRSYCFKGACEACQGFCVVARTDPHEPTDESTDEVLDDVLGDLSRHRKLVGRLRYRAAELAKFGEYVRRIGVLKDCPTCRGTGRDPREFWPGCAPCQGFGVVGAAT